MNTPRFRFRWLAIVLAAGSLAVGIAMAWPWYVSNGYRTTFQKGMQAFQQNNIADLTIAIEKLSKSSEYEAHYHLLRGLLLMHQQSGREALEEFSASLGDEDTTALALTYSGQILHFAKDHASAERMLLAAVEADPRLVEPHRLLAAAYYDVGAMDNALKHLAKVIELAPEDMRPWRLRGLILKDFEKYDEAASSYEGAIERAKEEYIQQELNEELAECLVRLRRYDEALDRLKRIKPTAESKSLEADSLLALGRVEEAEKSLTEALQLDASHLRAMTIQSSLLIEQEKLPEAKKQLEKAIAAHPYEFNLRSMLMQLLVRMGDKEGASLQEAKSKELRDLKDKFAKLHIDSINHPSDPNIRFELGNTACDLGMMDAAVSWYQATLRMNPSHQAAQQRLTQLLFQMPRPEK